MMSLDSVHSTPAYGQRLLPHLVDERATTMPDRIMYSFANTDRPSEGFLDVTAQQFANAVNRAAWWIQSFLGKGTNFPTVGYIGPGDLRYQILGIALVKVGFKALLISPRNSLEGDLNVIDQSSCHIWFLPSQRLGNINKILKIRQMRTVHVPELNYFLEETAVSHYPYEKTYEEARRDPFIILHTSGSTGLPKPVVLVNSLMSIMDAQHLLEPVPGRILQLLHLENSRIFSAFPAFHSAGVYIHSFVAFYYNISIVQVAPGSPITADTVDGMCDYANIEGVLTSPVTLEEIAERPASIERLRTLKFLCGVGGPLLPTASLRISPVKTVDNIIGSTEGCMTPLILAEKDEANYMYFHPGTGLDFREVSEGIYELWQVRDPKLELHQGLMKTFWGENEVSFKDLFSKHPTKHGLWRYRGRADDIIVLTNGEKLNPLTMEQKISENPYVSSAMVVGQARFQTAVIIEPTIDLNDLPISRFREIRQSIEDIVKEANRPEPKHAHVKEGFLMFIAPGKHFLRAGKGTVQRAPTVQLYKDEIDALYSSQQSSSSPVDLDTSSLESLTKSLHSLCLSLSGDRKIGVDEDFFSTGFFDSLSVLTLSRKLRAFFDEQDELRVQSSLLGASFIYGSRSISTLSEKLYDMVNSKGPGEDEDVSTEVRQKMVERLFSKYAKNLPATSKREVTVIPEEQATVILTGSTGSLGSYLLDALLRNPQVGHIVCLNRAKDAKTRQEKLQEVNGLTMERFDSVEFMQVRLSEELLGLSEAQYTYLLERATHIIHSQWQVDFNLSLQSFEPHIHGVRRLIEFSAQSTLGTKIVFISSISSTIGQGTDSVVPEALLDTSSYLGTGYGASKLVSERLFNQAAKMCGVESTICRVGQIGGPVRQKRKGMWNKQEWLPTIVSTSAYLKVLPSSIPSFNKVDWIPVDILSDVITEHSGLSTTQYQPESSLDRPKSTPISFLHVVNPASTTWDTLTATILASLPKDTALVDWQYWVSALRDSAERSEVGQHPGIKLLDFYAGLGDLSKIPELSVMRAKERSPTMRKLRAVSNDWMKIWLEQWGF